MPFTFAHPAAVLPLNYLKKKWLSLTALVTGSITPDFEYFIRMKDFTMYSHTWAGIFWYDLPLSILLSLIFHNLVRTKLILYSPLILKKRLWKYKEVNWNKRFKEDWFIVVTSFLIGIISHLLLDRFTHKTVHLINSLPSLQSSSLQMGYRQVSYFLFWDFNSLVGILIVIYSIWQLPVGPEIRRDRPISGFWLQIFALNIFIITIRFIFFDHWSIPNFIVSTISSSLVSLVLVCLWTKIPLPASSLKS